MWIFLNDRFVRKEAARVSVFDHGFFMATESTKRCAPMMAEYLGYAIISLVFVDPQA